MTTMDEVRRKEAEQANRPQEETHSVPRGQRLRDGLYMAPEELEEHNLQPGGSVQRRIRRGEL